jgi:hypothetical protein
MEISCNSIDEINLIQFCSENGISLPKYETKIVDGKYLSKASVDGEILAEGLDSDEKEAIKSSAQSLLFKLKNKLENTGHISSKVNNEANGNPIGDLQELCAQKGYSSPEYKSIKMGYDHSPNFITKCKLIIDGNEVVGEGRGRSVKVSKKAAAEEIIRKLNALNFNNYLETPDSEFESKLIRFLSETFSYNFELNIYIEDNENKDYCKKLDKIAPIIGCDVKFTESKDNKVVLRLIIPHLNNYVLITTYGSSDEGLKESKEIAAKKAILSLQILNENNNYYSYN